MDGSSLFIFILGGIAYIIIVIQDKLGWVDVYGGSQSNLPEVNARYSYLKAKGVKCRLKTKTHPFSRMQLSQTTTAVIEVKKSHEAKARDLLNEFYFNC
ncbi:hypothetical protein SYNTR_1336 [Candidatus Syntrophocurvum alkaliphilum]|uniref:DUF2007 domain-containing protein n=1 Tax=Candidatus Syntrophocurvum alkaliphilum TaxID=2293317 RepID=A0A6I6DCG0_9FIRM|nr:hypothetical protein [Candidatus Syntrophocurvum alkaliphilum]QGT99929.1 hypothetical protein SYNTR_1336 [Candidatus Syntrophocurvum alkaliphilum]